MLWVGAAPPPCALSSPGRVSAQASVVVTANREGHVGCVRAAQSRLAPDATPTSQSGSVALLA